MGIRRFTMPLLSTLAALVIIVHSAEEDRGYRRELRPRVVNTASYEQPWRAIDSEPLLRQSTRTETWNDSPEELTERRRPVRKRKRRPNPYPDSDPQERQQESIGPYHDTDYHDSQQTAETRKRRKRPDIKYYLPEEPLNTNERPLRRRGLRRKRPVDYTQDETQMAELIAPEPVEYYGNDRNTQNFSKHNQFDVRDSTEHTNTERTRVYLRVEIDNLANRYNTLPNNVQNIDMPLPHYNKTFRSEDKSNAFVNNRNNFAPFQDSSSSVVDEIQDERPKPRLDNLYVPKIDKLEETDKSDQGNNEDIMAMIKNSKKNGVIDPMMLKQILKRSSGSSLSEMLQRHNLSLADLLQGKDEAVSALDSYVSESKPQILDTSLEKTPQLKEAESKYPSIKQTPSEPKSVPTESISDEDIIETTTPVIEKVTVDDIDTEDQTIQPRISAKRRFPNGIRRKLRMRPMLNSTLKAQLSRDLMALTARKYSRNNRNVTKSREWKDIVPFMADRSKSETVTIRDEITETAPTTTDTFEDTTTMGLEMSNSSYSGTSETEASNIKENEVENTAATTTEPTTTITIEVTPPFETNGITERPKVTPIVRPATNNSALRRQAFNNRLKRKRLKHKSSTTENPSDDLMKNFLGVANLVSASQFIERTQKPYTTVKDNTDFATDLEDFMTTQTPETTSNGEKSTKNPIPRSTALPITKMPSQRNNTSTEQAAQFEIEEILNDTMTSERLAKILRERNMTLSELVNHRERGSSHVHLADIFHNASKEPNPPEPFLTKSSIEPISKETYPLRAILEANPYETTTRPVTQTDPKHYLHIPVVMDFGNNVNENGESMGIISLFNKLTDSEITLDKQVQKDSDGTPYVSSVISVNTTNANETNRESRVLTSNEDWNELLSFMKEHNITTFEDDLQGMKKGDADKDALEDLDGDSLMVLEDMQHLHNFESNIAPGSDENIEIKMYERREHLSEKPGILNKLPNNTKSVAIATASILGLAAILFLLTYIAFKWKQQRNKLRKKESFCVDQIPSPVFENRKSHKNNCSSRSISPMISSTNIYMSTLESQNGKESPEYMWNSLRKPFQ